MWESVNENNDFVEENVHENEFEVIQPTKIQNRVPGRPPKHGGPALTKITMSKCEYCETTCRAGVMLKRHIAKYHPDVQNTFPCTFCTLSYASQKELLHHSLQHWEIGSTCPLVDECNCKLKFSRRAVILTHLLNKHTTDTVVVETIPKKPTKKEAISCKFCSKTFPKMTSLRKHYRVHTGEKPYVCTYCSTGFSQKSSLDLHIYTHTNEKPHKCSLCPASFTQTGNLKLHVKNSHPTVIPPNVIHCPYCPCVFRFKHFLQDHINKLHKNLTDDQLICETINDVMKSLASLNEDSQTDTQMLQNDLFSDDFSSKLDISLNKEFSVVDEKSFPNSSLFSEKDSENDKYFQCTACPKVFRKNSNLLRHFSIHLNLKPFKCDICSKCFRQSSHLYDHQRNFHKIIPIHKKPIVQQDNFSTTDTSINFHEKDSAISIQNKPNSFPNLLLENIEINTSTMNFQLLPTESIVDESNIDADISSLCDSSLLNNTSFNNPDCSLNFNMENIYMDSIIDNTTDQTISNEPLQITPYENNILECDDQTNSISNVYLGNILIDINGENNAIDDSTTTVLTNNTNFIIDNVIDMGIDHFNESDIEKVNELPNNIQMTSSIEETAVFNPTVDSVLLNFNDQIVDPDILKFIDQNSVPCDALESNSESNIVKNRLKMFKEIMKMSKHKYKNPPLSNRCEFCPASFGKPSDLVRHRRTHTKEKPFSCEICSRCFSFKSTLKCHMRIHFADERQKLACQVCGKKFSTTSALSLHKSLHIGKRPYSCPICFLNYRTSGHRDCHLKNHFKIKDKKTSK